MILVLSPEVVHDARPVVVHPSHETSAPVVVIERSRALRFVEAVEGVLQLPASVHCHEPDTTPLVEEACHARVDEFRFRCTVCTVSRPTKLIKSNKYLANLTDNQLNVCEIKSYGFRGVDRRP